MRISYLNFKAMSLLWVGSMVSAGFTFLTQILLARELTPAALGVFSAALGTTLLIAPLAGFGVAGFWLKTFGEEGWAALRWLSSSFRFIAMSSALIGTILWSWALFGPHSESMSLLLMVLSVCLLGQTSMELIIAKLQLEERYISLAAWQISFGLLRLVLIVLLSAFALDRLSILTAAIAYSITAAITFVVGLVMMFRIYQGQIALVGHGSSGLSVGPTPQHAIRQIAAQAWPFGLAGIFYLVYFQSDIILLKYLASDEDAGYYNVAFTLIAAAYLLPGAVYQKFLMPKLHRWANHDRARFFKTYQIGNIAMLSLGLLVMLAIWLLASPIIVFVFGAQYTEAISIVVILAIAVPFRFFASSAGAAISTQHHIRNKSLLMGVGAIINVVLNCLAIPTYGTTGAAVATVATELLLTVMIHYYARGYVFAEFADGNKH